MGHKLLAAGIVGRIGVRGFAREQKEERAAEAVDVRADVGRRGVLPLLGRHVVDRAHGYARLRQPSLLRRVVAPFGMELGQPQVQQLHLTAATEHQVGRLDVAMHQLMFVGMLQAQGRLADDLARRTSPQRPARRPAHADELLQVDAVDELHDQELDAARLAGVKGPHDVRMIQSSDRLHLAAETAQRLGIIKVTVRQDLQGDRLVEIDLAGLVDDAHAAATEFLQQFVVAQPAGLDDPAEDAFNQIGAFRKAAAVLFHLQECPAPLAKVEFDLQQFREQTVLLARGGLEQ